MKSKYSRIGLGIFVCAINLLGIRFPANAALFSDDFQSYSSGIDNQSGGSGWTTAWTVGSQNTGGAYLSTGTQIDGTQSYGLYGNDGSSGTSRNRGFDAISSPFTLTFSFRANYDVTTDDGNGSLARRIAFTIRDANSTDHFSGQRLSFFFAEGSNQIQWYDGTDRSSANVTFTSGHVYDFTVTLDPSDRSYGFTATDRTTTSTVTYSDSWSLGSNGEALDSIAFLMRGPSGGGNDAFLDSIQAVPEPINVALATFGSIAMAATTFRRIRAR